MRFISLFAGIGGFDLGFERAGMECAGQVEIDRFCRKVLEARFPGVKRMEDIRDVRGDEFGRVDVVCGGFPCQDLSVAGRRAGLAGERSGLFFEACRVVGAARPRWFVLENVPGLFSSDGGRDFLVVLRTLAELGYGLSWRVLDSQYFGLAQQRRRVFVVGHLGGPCPPEILFEPESVSGNNPPRREAGTRVAALTQNGVGTCGADDNQAQTGHLIAAPLTGNSYGDQISRESHLVAHAVSSKWAKGTGGPSGDECQNLIAFNVQFNDANGTRKDRLNGGMYITKAERSCALTGAENPCLVIGGEISHALKGEGFDGSEDGTGRGTPIVYHRNASCAVTAQDDRAAALRSEGEHSYQFLCYENHGQDSRVKECGDLSPQLNAKNGPGGNNLPLVQSGFIVRRLTPVECERLQGFPDNWTKLDDKTADGPRYKALGNAVSVPVAQWIGNRLT